MKRTGTFLLLCCIALAASAAPAGAAATRAEYISQVDPLCRSIITPVKNLQRSLNKAEKTFGKTINDPYASNNQRHRAANRYIDKATRLIARFNTTFGNLIDEIATVAPAPGDEAVVMQWVAELRQYLSFNERASTALRHHKIRQSIALSDQASDAGNAADNVVADFGFQYCA